MKLSDAIRKSASALRSGADVWQDIVWELNVLADCNQMKADRCRNMVRWIEHAPPGDGRRKKLLEYLLREGCGGEPTLEGFERIAGLDADGSLEPEGGLKRKSRECLRMIDVGVVCPYAIDVRSNTITCRKSGKCYKIPRGDASRVVNALVRGMLRGIKGKRDWLVKFTRREEKILHRNGDGTMFYNECVMRTDRKGDGNQKFGDTARLKA